MDRLFDKSNYGQKTLETYEIISAYYIDILYNHLYIEAKKLKVNKNVASITEGYKHALNAFLKSLDNAELYKKNISGLHHFFITLGFSSLTFSKCIDNITKEFIPTDYFASLSSSQKMGILKTVISNTSRNFIKKIVESYMVKVIDHHTDKENVRLMQDDFIECLILEREMFFQKFIGERTSTKVDNGIVIKMQNEISRLLKEKYELQKTNLMLKKLVVRYNQEKQNQEKQNSSIRYNQERYNQELQTHAIQSHKIPSTPQNKQSQDRQIPDIQPIRYNQERQSPSIHQSHEPQSQIELPKSNIYALVFDQKKQEPIAEIDESKIEVIDDEDDSCEEEENTNFIEVKNNNVDSIINCNNDNLYKYMNHSMDNDPLRDFE
jgi:hypothetical protein